MYGQTISDFEIVVIVLLTLLVMFHLILFVLVTLIWYYNRTNFRLWRQKEASKNDQIEPFTTTSDKKVVTSTSKAPSTLSFPYKQTSWLSRSKLLPVSRSTFTGISKPKLPPAPPDKQFVSHRDERFGDENLNKIKAKVKISQTKKLSDSNHKESHKMKLKHSRSWDPKNNVFMSKSCSTNSHKKETISSTATTVPNGYVAAQTFSTSSNEQFPSQDSVDEYSYSTPAYNYNRQGNYCMNTSTPSSTPFSSKIYHLDTDELFIRVNK